MECASDAAPRFPSSSITLRKTTQDMPRITGDNPDTAPIAVVGMALRVPGATTLARLLAATWSRGATA